jgi:hypothetical protein
VHGFSDIILLKLLKPQGEFSPSNFQFDQASDLLASMAAPSRQSLLDNVFGRNKRAPPAASIGVPHKVLVLVNHENSQNCFKDEDTEEMTMKEVLTLSPWYCTIAGINRI